jgi:hypothetical protein
MIRKCTKIFMYTQKLREHAKQDSFISFEDYCIYAITVKVACINDTTVKGRQ